MRDHERLSSEQPEFHCASPFLRLGTHNYGLDESCSLGRLRLPLFLCRNHKGTPTNIPYRLAMLVQ